MKTSLFIQKFCFYRASTLKAMLYHRMLCVWRSHPWPKCSFNIPSGPSIQFSIWENLLFIKFIRTIHVDNQWNRWNDLSQMTMAVKRIQSRRKSHKTTETASPATIWLKACMQDWTQIITIKCANTTSRNQIECIPHAPRPLSRHKHRIIFINTMSSIIN